MHTAIEILLSNSLLACGLAVAATVLTKIWKNPHLSHALWVLVLVKLVTPPLTRIPVPLSIGAGHVEVSATHLEPHKNRSSAHFDSQSEWTGLQATTVADRPADTGAASTFRRSHTASTGMAIGENVPLWTLAGWCLGTIVFLSIAGWRHWRLRKLLSDARPPDVTIDAEALRISRQMGLTECPPIRVTTAHLCPLVVIGWRQQTVVLPCKLFDQLNSEQLRSVIAHELAHIRRGDHWVRLFETLVLAIQWWNPLAWWASRQLRRTEEECCDAWVVWVLPDGRRSYGQALLRTVEFLTEEKSIVVGANLAFGRSMFQRRIEMILNREMPHRMSRKVAGVILVVSAIVLPVAARSQDSDDPGEGGTQPVSQQPKEGDSDKPEGDGGSDFLRDLWAATTPILAHMAEQEGYGLKPGQFVRRVPPPFPEIRMHYYRLGKPSQSAAMPAGPTAMTFHWENEELQNWGMAFGQKGYNLSGVLNALLGIKRQMLEGPSDLLRTRLPGDWVVRPDAAKEDVVEQLATILRDKLDLDVRLEFRTVEREVYVASGHYELTPLPGKVGEVNLRLADETILIDQVQIFGKELVPGSGGGGGTGDFDEFLGWLGRWIDSPIVNEVTGGPTRQLGWLLHARSPSTDQTRREDHDPEMVLENITKQTDIRFTKETRPIELLFVERI